MVQSLGQLLAEQKDPGSMPVLPKSSFLLGWENNLPDLVTRLVKHPCHVICKSWNRKNICQLLQTKGTLYFFVPISSIIKCLICNNHVGLRCGCGFEVWQIGKSTGTTLAPFSSDCTLKCMGTNHLYTWFFKAHLGN